MSRRTRLPVILALGCFAALAACAPQGPGGPAALAPQPAADTSGQALAGDLVVGRRALASGDAVLAKRAFTAAMRKDPNNPEVVLGMAEAHLALAELDAAGQLFDVLAGKAPGLSARVRQGQGLVALRTGRDDRAIQLLGDAVQRDSGLWRAWLGLGQAHDRQGEATAARRAFAAAERTAPRQAAVQNDIGMTYLSEKQPKKALRFFRTALKIDPGFQVARANVRIAHAMVGDYENAIAGAPERGMADVLNNVGYVAILNRDFDVADRLLRRALEVSPTYHEAAVANLDLLARMADGGGTPSPVAADDGEGAAPKTADAETATGRQDRAETLAALALQVSADADRGGEASPQTAQHPTAPAKPARAAALSTDAGDDRAFRWADSQVTPGATASGRPNAAASAGQTPRADAAARQAPEAGAPRAFRWRETTDEAPISAEASDARPAARLKPITNRVELGRRSADRLLAQNGGDKDGAARQFTWTDAARTTGTDVEAGPEARTSARIAAPVAQQARMEDDGFLWID